MTDGVDPVDAALGEVAAETGGTLRRAPGAGREARRVVLRDVRDDQGSQFDAAVVEDDGTVRVLGAGYYQRTQGRIGDLLRRPEVAAEFSNWHS